MSENQKCHQKIIETKIFTKEPNLSILVPVSPRLAPLKRNDVIDDFLSDYLAFILIF